MHEDFGMPTSPSPRSQAPRTARMCLSIEQIHFQRHGWTPRNRASLALANLIEKSTTKELHEPSKKRLLKP